jgi:N-acetylglucosaminyl-diphospho-decaprenol L-rhamnosyltransferase
MQKSSFHVMPHSKPITVSIVSHGHAQMVRQVIKQLDRYSHAVIEKIVLTINIPEIDTDEIQASFPIQIIRNSRPKGFGANHNYAFKHCSAPWFLVLNPDIQTDDDVLTLLLQAAHPRTGVLTPRIREPEAAGSEKHRRTITPLEIVRRRRPSYVAPRKPDWIPGMFMLFRSEVFDQINGFDEKFFMYAEDFDICARTVLEGWELQVVDEMTVLHDARRASRKMGKHLFLHASSLLKLWSSQTFWKYMHFTRRNTHFNRR